MSGTPLRRSTSGRVTIGMLPQAPTSRSNPLRAKKTSDKEKDKDKDNASNSSGQTSRSSLPRTSKVDNLAALFEVVSIDTSQEEEQKRNNASSTANASNGNEPPAKKQRLEKNNKRSIL